MVNDRSDGLRARVRDAAEAALARQGWVSRLDMLIGVGWLPVSTVDRWRQGRVDSLEGALQVKPGRRQTAIRWFEEWARERGLLPSETSYVASTRDRRPLRFTVEGSEGAERAYRTHWVSPELSERRREQLIERQSRAPDLVVISPLNEWECSTCGGTGDFLIMEQPGPVCLTCADMDHLLFLPAGNATLSRRAKKASRLSAVVVRFSRTRKRYERRGVLVEEAALEQAEAECLADAEVRARRRERDVERRTREDLAFQERMAREIVRLFPGCPGERAEAIARHAGARGSGRVGRTTAGRALDEEAIVLAVRASVRHEDTPYDELLMTGVPREEARERVWDQVERVLEGWRRPAGPGRR